MSAKTSLTRNHKFVNPSGLKAAAAEGSPCQLRNKDGALTPSISFNGQRHIGGSVTVESGGSTDPGVAVGVPGIGI